MRRRLEPGHPAGLRARTCGLLGRRIRLAGTEARLNSFDQFVTDGLDIHFIHQRNTNPDALPLQITHGWPGSIVEFAKVIGPLTQDFHVVCPSLPGYGFSGKPTGTGWTVERIAAAWDVLMKRLGYDRYGAQGGDWGAAVTTQIGRNGFGCMAIHTNMPIARPAGPLEDPTSAERMRWRRRAALPGVGGRLFQTAVHPPADAGLRAGRLPGGTAGVDRGEVPGLE